MIEGQKNTTYEYSFPAINAANPAYYVSGETIATSAEYRDTGGAWTSISVGSPAERGTTGIYVLSLTAPQRNHDQLVVKFTSSGMVDDGIAFDLFDEYWSNSNNFDPANDNVAKVDVVCLVQTVENIINVTNIASSAAQSCEVFNAVQPYRPGLAAIILNVRDSLSDPNGDRYTTARLTRLADKAQQDLNIRAKLLRNKVVLSLSAENSAFALPVNTRLLTRVIGEDGTIQLITHSIADEKFGIDWETETGTGIEAIVYDYQNAAGFKVYPIQEVPVDDDAINIFAFGPTGVLYNLEDYTAADDYGIVTDLTDADDDTADYGIITNIIDIPIGFKLTMYTLVNCDSLTYAVDDDMNDVFSALQLPATYDIMLEHYITGMAFRDDIDTQNRSLGNEHLASYADLVQRAISDSSKNHTEGSDVERAKPNYTTGI